MTLKISFSNEVETRLREVAQSAGKDIEGFVRQAVEEKLANSGEANSTQSPPPSRDLWLEKFDAWVNSHPIRDNVNLDDSREGIYAGRGE